MASLGLWTFAILQSGFNLSERGPCKFAVWFESLRRFGSVASLPIESRPCFPRMASQRNGSSSPSGGDHYNSEKAGASCWSPRTWLCEGISPLGYWQKVNQSPTQTKPYNTLPPFEQRDSWSSCGAVRAYSEVLFIISGDPGRVINQILDMRKYTFL